MKNFLVFFFISSLLILNNCSFDNKSGVWKDHNKKVIQKVKKDNQLEQIFKEVDIFNEEISNKVVVDLPEKIKNVNWLESNLNENNNVPHLSYENKKNRVLKSKKIGKSNFSVDQLESDLFILEDNIFFSDFNGNIYCFSTSLQKILWKFNFYKRKYKNIPIKTNLKIINKSLIVSDNLGYFYNIDLNNGKLKWAKNQGVPLTSEIKSSNQKTFLLNQDNKFYIFENKNGKKILDFETFPIILKKNIKQTLALDSRDNLYFVTSAGQIFSLNHVNYKINWIKNIKDATTSDEFGLFYSSPMVVDDQSIYISSAKTTMSIDIFTGKTNWKIPFGTKIKPIISNEFIFLVSNDGFLLNANLSSGKIIWSKKLFKSKNLNSKKIGDVSSLFLLANQLFMTTKNGFFFFVNYNDGQIINYTKVAKGFFSKPSVANNKIYIIDKNMSLMVVN